VARSLDPDFDMWSASEPIIRDWFARNMGPLGVLEDVAGAARWMRRLIAVLPELGERAGDVTRGLARQSREGLALHPDSVEAIATAAARRIRRGQLALWVIAIAGVVMAIAALN